MTTATKTTTEDKTILTNLLKCRENYMKTKDEHGKHIDCGDIVAVELREMTLEDVYTILEEATGEDWHQRYTGLNEGMQRMNLGNRIRKLVKLTGVDSVKELNLKMVKMALHAKKQAKTEAKALKADQKKEKATVKASDKTKKKETKEDPTMPTPTKTKRKKQKKTT